MAVTLDVINISSPDDGLGDPLRTGGGKINDNTTKLRALAKTIEDGDFQTFKFLANEDINTLQINDVVSGWFNNVRFFNAARYDGGDVANPASYTIFEEIDLS